MRKSSALVLSFISTSLLFFAAPAQTVTTPVIGLKSNVTVRRDSRDIPYIEASSDTDLYFAQGFITASDRLWQMDLMRRLARGQTAEIFGNAALDQDKRWRRFGFAGVANDSLSNLSPELRAALND